MVAMRHERGSAAVRRTSPSKRRRPVTMTASSGNVFRGLGFSPVEAECLLVPADLMIEVQKAIAAMGFKQAEAAKTLRMPRSRISDLLGGRIDLFSTDALIETPK